ncbi:phosphotransferase [Micromonospora sp. Llam0]|uniref:phosphotransferase n=1 Tax=Micromonospora sp. Llam0 TaxID=2485143 RepID=UPI000F4718EE|nr:phosphotransferase [Micromonospora sp. Llam0]
MTAAFDLGTVQDIEVIDAGLMNRNWRVTTDRGMFAVKQVRDIDAVAARRQHAATRVLAERGRPVPAPLTVPGGDTLLEYDGDVYAVTAWAQGTHREGLELSLIEVESLGALLAELHVDLAQIMPAAPETMCEPVTEPATTKDKIDRYMSAASARSDRDAMDEFVLDRLRLRTQVLAQVGHLRPDDEVEVGPCGWVHGDFQHLNVLFDGDKVSAVLDWDRLKPRPLAAEVVRSATLLFGFGDAQGLDLARVGAFVSGYRSRRELSDEALADAVHRLWWERVCGTWQLRRRYEHADTSCDHLFRSAEGLLSWWTGHRPQVSAAFTGRR